MVYKKYVYKRGKRHGPYYYHSIRQGSSVRKVYIGGEKEYQKWLRKKVKRRTTINKKFLIPLFLILVLAASLFFLQQDITGKANLEIRNTYIQGENLSGVLKLSLRKGELIPIDSKIIVEQLGKEREYELSQFIHANSEGNFYVENTDLSGKGQGYGFSGVEESYPAVFFTLKILEQESEDIPSGGAIEPPDSSESTPLNETEIAPENITEPTEQPSENETDADEPEEPETTEPKETPETPAEEETTEPTEEPETLDATDAPTEKTATDEPTDAAEPSESSESTDGSAESSSPLTGAVVTENKKLEEVEGSCSKDDPFTYGLEDGIVEIKKNSVEIETEGKRKKISDDEVSLSISGDVATVTTNYVSVASGEFGEEFLGDETKDLEIGLEDLNLRAENGELKITLVYKNTEIVSASQDINVEQLNETLIENITELNETLLDLNETNMTLVNASENITITTIQTPAVIGQPVKWKKEIKLDIPKKITIDLPGKAENITVKRGVEISDENEEETGGGEVQESVVLTGEVSAEIKLKKPGLFTKIWNTIKRGLRLTGKVIQEEIVEVTLEDNATEFTIEYETPAPQAVEEEIEGGKRVTITGPDELHYENVLAYTELSESLNISKAIDLDENITSGGNLFKTTFGEDDDEVIIGGESKVGLYWSEQNKSVNFTSRDLDENGKDDYIEWIVPSLSNQTYEIKAEGFKPEIRMYKWNKENSLVVGYDNKNFSDPVLENKKVKAENGKEEVVFYKLNDEDFEFEVILKERPESNVLSFYLEGWEEYNFYFQDFLINSTRHFKDGEWWITAPNNRGGELSRPERVDGSYAVYHKTKRNYESGKTNYKTGKLGHIYRPYLTDANNNSIWADLYIENGTMTITSDENWLENAEYPVIIDPTFGNIGIGGSSTSIYENRQTLIGNSSFNPENNGTAKNISLYFHTDNQLSNITFGFYIENATDWDDDGLIADTGGDAYTIASGSQGWHTQDLDSPAAIYTNEIYYPSYNFNTDYIYYFYDNGGNSGWAEDSYVHGTLKGGIASENIIDTELISLYISYDLEDKEYPIFSNYQDNNGTLTDSGTAWFNVTIEPTNGTVLLEINNTNYTATNLTADVYNVSVVFPDGSNGTYDYYWHSWGNGTESNYNVSVTRSYTINPDTTPPTLTIEDPANDSRFNESFIEFNVSGDEELTYCGLSINGDANDTMTEFNTTYFNYTNSSIAEGSHTFLISCNDTYDNFGASSLYDFSVDTVFPDINFTDPTPADGANQSNTDVFVNVSASDSANNISTFIDWDGSLVGWWRMDDINDSGDVVEYFGRNNGTAEGGAVQTDAGYLGKGFEFDGDGDKINIGDPDIVEGLSAMTVMAWIKTAEDDFPVQRGIVAQKGTSTDAFGFNIADNDNLGFQVITSGGSSGASATDWGLNKAGEWHHVVGLYNSTGAFLFADGVLIDVGDPHSGTIDATTNDLRIGEIDNERGDRIWNGTIDDVMIFNRSLTQAEIQALYANKSSEYLEKNFTGLAEGTHTFKAYTQDLGGNVNSTETRSVTYTLTNVWTCDSNQLFTNTSCWSLSLVPIAGHNVVFNSSGTGDCNITNNTMPQDLNSFTVEEDYIGTIWFAPLFAVGNWTGNEDGTQLWNVTNNINISNGTMKIYGDGYNVTESWMGCPGMHNITDEGHGQEWRSVSGNITIGSQATLDGVGLGFSEGAGPGGGGTGYRGGSHGGRGGLDSADRTYGNASAPTSLGSSGGDTGLNWDRPGGSAIKLYASLGDIIVNGMIEMNGSSYPGVNYRTGAGGSIWLKGDRISIIGTLSAAGGISNSPGGGGGRIMLDYTSSLNLTGKVNVEPGGGSSFHPKIGTLSFTNNTYPGDLIVNGTIGLTGGNHTVEGDLILKSGSVLGIKAVDNKASDNGTGVYINVTGNVVIEQGANINGIGEGFLGYHTYEDYGPGEGAWNQGATHGGRGYQNTRATYGSETYPTSLGSATDGNSGYHYGGGAIKIVSGGNITINGSIKVNGERASGNGGGAGGSILLIAKESISGFGALNATGGYSSYAPGGGGRIALHAKTINYSGLIVNEGGIETDGGSWVGSGGTVYINATTSVISSMNVSVVGFNGTSTEDWGQRINITGNLLTLSGVYNASRIDKSVGGIVDGKITAEYTNCGSTFPGVFDPNLTYISSCDYISPTVALLSPTNDSASSSSTQYFAANFTDDIQLVNATLYIWNSTNDEINKTTNAITGTSNSSNISVTLPNTDTFEWNYYVCDNATVPHCSWNETNWTYVYSTDSTPPNIYLESPANNALNTTDSTPDFVFNVTDDSLTLDCYLWLRDSSGANSTYGRNSSTLNATSTTITANATLLNGDYLWWINCSDAFNSNVSEERNLSINIPPPGVEFVSPTPVDGKVQAETNVEINVSIMEKGKGLDEVKFNWNGTNYTLFDDSVVFYVNFDNRSSLGENDTHVVDLTGIYGNCTKVGTLNFISGKYSEGVNFPGSTEHFDCQDNDNVDLSGNLTVCFWTNPDSLGSQRENPLGKDYGDEFTITFEDSPDIGRIHWYHGASRSDYYWARWATGTVSNDSWQYLCFVRDIGTQSLNLYKDGNLVSLDAEDTWTAPSTGSYDLNIGAQYLNAINGQLDEVLIFNRTLSASEVQQLYFTNLYKFNQTQWYLYVNQSKNSTEGLDDASYTYFASAKDDVGNENITEERTVTVDTTYPTLNITYPINTSCTTSTHDLNYTVTESNCDSAWYNNGTGNSSKVACGTNWSAQTAVGGSNTWTVYINDTAGNENSSSVTFSVDAINTWISASNQLFSNATAWSSGSVPIAGQHVIFNGSGTGDCNITNNTMPQDLNSFTVEDDYTGTIYFAPLFGVGNWTGNNDGSQLWNVTNNITINNGTMKIYGDGYNSSLLGWAGLEGMNNITDEGHGQEWRSVSGNISIGSEAVLDGVGLGFVKEIGPAPGSYTKGAAGHGGRGDSSKLLPYGNASAPTSLGSGSSRGTNSCGGSGIKLEANGDILINGIIFMNGTRVGSPANGGAGGSVWLKGNNISGNGMVIADGGRPTSYGGGGRIRFEFNNLSYNGKISVEGGDVGDGRPGTFSFKYGNQEGVFPSSWTLNGTIGLAGGNYTVLGNLVVPNETTLGLHPVNYAAADNGTGVYINVTGNVTIENTGKIDGDGEGFYPSAGPGGSGSGQGGTHGGRGGNNNDATYGSEIQPLSLGSGGQSRFGGGAIKLETTQNIIVNGEITVRNTLTSSPDTGGAGGSIWLKASNISGDGILNTTGGDDSNGGGGGRIALHADTIDFSGVIDNEGGENNPVGYASGGTVYINATTITSSMNISVVGFNGSTSGDDWGQRINFTGSLMTLSGIYNATVLNQSVAGINNGTITLNFTDCSSNFANATFEPDAIYKTGCGPNVTIITPLNNTFTGNETVNFTANISDVTGVKNVVVGIPVVLIEGTYSWFFEFWNWADNFVNTQTTVGNMTLTVDLTYPLINFTDPTPSSGSSQAATAIFVNVSANGSSGVDNNISTFIDWDGSLVGWWRMDDVNSSGDVVDYLGLNNGTVVGDALQVSNGKLGAGFEFDGDGDRVDMGSISQGGNELTLSWWMKVNDNSDITTGSAPVIIDWMKDGGDYRDGTVLCYIKTDPGWSGGSYATNGTICTYSSSDAQLNDVGTDFNSWYGSWHQVVYVLNNTNATIYVDGKVENSVIGAGSIAPENEEFSIGYESWLYGGDFNGTIDDVLIFNRSLSADEILALYANQSTNYAFNNFTDLAEGTHTFKGYTQDQGGNVNSTATRRVTVTSASISSCQNLTVENGIYTLTSDVSSVDTCMNIIAHNVTLDGQGYNITYATTSTGYGVVTNGYDNLTIKNLDIILDSSSPSTSSFAVYLLNSEGNEILNNTIITNGSDGGSSVYNYGMYFSETTDSQILNNSVKTTQGRSYPIYLTSNSDYNVVDKNNITTGGYRNYGIYLSSADFVNITNNNVSVISTTRQGLRIVNSQEARIINNTINNTGSYQIDISGSQIEHYLHTIENNTGRGLPICGFRDQQGFVLENLTENDCIMIFVINSTGAVINNVSLTDGEGLHLFVVNDSNVTSSYFESNDGYREGIVLEYSYSNILDNNTIDTSGGYYVYGINLQSSGSNSVINNNISTGSADGIGILLVSANSNNLTNNTVLSSSKRGHLITLSSSGNNIIEHNVLGNIYSSDDAHAYGIRIISNSDSNVFNNNTIKNTGEASHGIYIDDSLSNEFSNITINVTDAQSKGIYIAGGTVNFILRDSEVNSMNDSFYSSGVANGEFNFTNVTFNQSEANWNGGSNGTLFVHWYLDANVTSNNYPVNSATVTSYDDDYNEADSGTTDSNGQYITNLLNYYENVTSSYYEGNYTVNTTKTNYRTDSQSINMSGNQEINVSLNATLHTWVCSSNQLL